MDLVSINGKFENNISVKDRGLLFGESVFEVIPLYNKKPFLLDVHLERLISGFRYFSEKPLPIRDIRKWLQDYIRKLPDNFFDNVYIQVTTGQMNIRDHRPDHNLTPTIIIHQTEMYPFSLKRYEAGFKAICVQDRRSDFSCIKSNHLAHNVKAIHEAESQGYDTGIFVKNGCAIEGASSNIFAVTNSKLVTPPIEGILAGVTRKITLEIAKKLGIPIEITHIPLLDLHHADEVFLTSSTKMLMPLVEIRGYFKKESPGPIWHKIFKEYSNIVFDLSSKHIPGFEETRAA